MYVFSCIPVPTPMCHGGQCCIFRLQTPLGRDPIFLYVCLAPSCSWGLTLMEVASCWGNINNG